MPRRRSEGGGMDPSQGSMGSHGLSVRDDAVTGISGIMHELKVVRMGEEDMIYVDKPLIDELDALRLLVLHIDTGLKIYLDAPADRHLYKMLLQAGALHEEDKEKKGNGEAS